jgi:quercetin 2,3-dioxygenase
MLDSFASDNPDDYIGGFPDHPHRGFETVTYMLEGFMRHRDSAGHEGLLGAGDMQWMTAGRGVIHSELPEQDHGRMEGFQVWLNLPARDKLCDPWYRDFASDEIPEFEHAGVVARVLAGASHGVAGAVQRPVTQALILDLHFEPGARFVHALADTHNAFVHVYRGELVIGGQPIGTGQTAIFDNMPRRDGVAMRTAAKQWARALLFAGKPLDEPIIQYGPFVMNSTEQIQTAVEDFQSGRFA